MEQFAFSEAHMAGDAGLEVGSEDLLYVRDSRPLALLIADGLSTTGAVLAAGGARLLDRATLADADARLDRCTNLDLVVVECRDADPHFAPLLVRLNRLADDAGVTLVVACGLDSVDQAFALLWADGVQLLCDPNAFDLAAAIAMGLQRRETGPLCRDSGKDNETDRIERLSAEVSRLAHILDSLTADQSGSGALFRPASPEATPPSKIADRSMTFAGEKGEPLPFAHGSVAIEPGQIRDLLRARRQRDHYFPTDLFADPAWDMMLDLMAARLAGERVSVSSLCIAAAVPPTTALRWIRQLTDRAIFERQADPADGRRVFITLSEEAANAVTRWFAASRLILRDALA